MVVALLSYANYLTCAFADPEPNWIFQGKHVFNESAKYPRNDNPPFTPRETIILFS